jgi:acetylornithine deacetylase/succinyl-diaminopimelate desuccinylase-like protein
MHAAVQHVAAIETVQEAFSEIRSVVEMLQHSPGTTGTAHTPNEYIVIADVSKTTPVLVQVALTLLS